MKTGHSSSLAYTVIILKVAEVFLYLCVLCSTYFNFMKIAELKKMKKNSLDFYFFPCYSWTINISRLYWYYATAAADWFLF